MRRLLPLAALLLLPAAALAQEEESHSPWAKETTDRWVAWSRQRADRLLAERQWVAAAEEYWAWAMLDVTALEPCRRGAVAALFAMTESQTAGQKGKGFHALAERFITVAVQEKAPPLRGGRRDPVLAYVIGRLRLADEEFATAAQMLEQSRETLAEREAKGARDVLLNSVEVEPWRFRAVARLGAQLTAARRAHEARDRLTDIIRSSSTAPGVLPRDVLLAKVNLAGAYRVLDERLKAVEVLERLIADGETDAMVYDMLGQVLLEMGRVDEALEALGEALERRASSEHITPLIYRALALLRTSPPRADEAEAAVREFLKVRRDDPDALFVLGQVKQAKGEMGEATRIFREVLRRLPDSRVTLTRLLEVLSRSGAEEEELQRIRDRIAALDRKLADEAMTEEEREARDAGGEDAPADPASPGDAPR